MILEISVVQDLSACLRPDSPNFVPGAKPGMLMVGNEPRADAFFTVVNADVHWVKFPDLPNRVLYVAYAGAHGGNSLALRQRPIAAEVTGELRIGATYRLTAELCRHGEHSFYALKAVEVASPVRCTYCGEVYDLAAVVPIAWHADCTVYRAPCCGHEADDRDGVSLPSFRRLIDEED